MSARFLSLLGLGFGDCGKGRFVDQLCALEQAHSVVRFNGGAQAGHTVALADGRQHTFSQFGAGTFNSAVCTVLAAPVVVHPSALLWEAAALQQLAVSDPLARIVIDARCLVTTPFHQAAGRLREWQRGASAHGSCGVGVGETVRQQLQVPALAVCYGDLANVGSAAALLSRLQALREWLCADLEITLEQVRGTALQVEAELLRDESVALRWLRQIAPCMARVPAVRPEQLRQRLSRAGTVVFEGAQGILLDQWHGFHPHTTWSSTGVAAVEAVLQELGLEGECRHLGVLRCYATRHGAGPFPSEDEHLRRYLPEPDNGDEGWQGRFRVGQPDAVLLRYALQAVGRLDGILVSHVDALAAVPGGLRWCRSYRDPDSGEHLSSLPPTRPGDLSTQAGLGNYLRRIEPCFAERGVSCIEQWCDEFEQASACRPLLGSNGRARGQMAVIGDGAAAARLLPGLRAAVSSARGRVGSTSVLG